MVWSRKAGPLEQLLDHLLPKMPSFIDLPTFATDIKLLIYHYFTFARMTNITKEILVSILSSSNVSLIGSRMANNFNKIKSDR